MRAARLQIAVEIRRRQRTKRRNRRKTVDRGYVAENVSHTVPAAVGIARAQRAREALGVARSVTRLDQ
jgi:hypothetical protein